jgi:GT2 family glycosyltransferase
MEVLVVDGMSTDETAARAAETVRTFRQETLEGPSVEILENPKMSAPAALNIGLLKARGEVIVRVDGHCEIPPDYLERLVELLTDKEAQCVGGALLNVGEDRAAKAIATAVGSKFGVGGAAFRTSTKGEYVDTVAFGAYPREVFDRIGVFDEELIRNQDDEFNFRLTQSGGRIWLEPSLRVSYHSRATIGSLWRQYWQYGLYKILVFKKRRGVPAVRQLVPAAFVASLISAACISLVSRRWTPLAVVVIPYVAATGAATAAEAKGDKKLLPHLPIAFWTLHVAYGSGSIWGLWRWRKHGRS